MENAITGDLFPSLEDNFKQLAIGFAAELLAGITGNVGVRNLKELGSTMAQSFISNIGDSLSQTGSSIGLGDLFGKLGISNAASSASESVTTNAAVGAAGGGAAGSGILGLSGASMGIAAVLAMGGAWVANDNWERLSKILVLVMRQKLKSLILLPQRLILFFQELEPELIKPLGDCLGNICSTPNEKAVKSVKFIEEALIKATENGTNALMGSNGKPLTNIDVSGGFEEFAKPELGRSVLV